MPAQTPVSSSTFNSVAGDLRVHIAKFASVANADTYSCPITNILAVSIDCGNAASVQAGGTFASGTAGANGTVTFATTGTATNVSLIAMGQ